MKASASKCEFGFSFMHPRVTLGAGRIGLFVMPISSLLSSCFGIAKHLPELLRWSVFSQDL